MSESFGNVSTPKTNANNPVNVGLTPNQTLNFGFDFSTSTPQTKPSATMFPSSTNSNAPSTPKTTAVSSNPTLSNLVSSTSTPIPGTQATTSFPISATSQPLTTSQQFKATTTTTQAMPLKPAVATTATLSGTLGTTVTSAQGALSFGNLGKASPGTTAFSSIKTPQANSTTHPTTTTTSTLSLPTTTSLAGSLSSKSVTSTTASIGQPQSMTFQQLEELILNKWTAEMFEQEEVFLNQATQLNIWDKVINENAEKLTQLHATMEKVRKQQAKINTDLDLIGGYQRELENNLVPMEKEDLLSVLKADPNRKNLYINAKKIDSQIKSMSEDLKETIEHINETSRSHDTEDPVIQVGRILNAHMESLRWIDEHTARMQDYFDSLLKMHDDLRRECELTKHDIY